MEEAEKLKVMENTKKRVLGTHIFCLMLDRANITASVFFVVFPCYLIFPLAESRHFFQGGQQATESGKFKRRPPVVGNVVVYA